MTKFLSVIPFLFASTLATDTFASGENDIVHVCSGSNNAEFLSVDVSVLQHNGNDLVFNEFALGSCAYNDEVPSNGKYSLSDVDIAACGGTVNEHGDLISIDMSFQSYIDTGVLMLMHKSAQVTLVCGSQTMFTVRAALGVTETVSHLADEVVEAETLSLAISLFTGDYYTPADGTIFDVGQTIYAALELSSPTFFTGDRYYAPTSCRVVEDTSGTSYALFDAASNSYSNGFINFNSELYVKNSGTTDVSYCFRFQWEAFLFSGLGNEGLEYFVECDVKLCDQNDESSICHNVINEMQSVSCDDNPCGDNSVCTMNQNLDGYSCSCNEGFEGDPANGAPCASANANQYEGAQVTDLVWSQFMEYWFDVNAAGLTTGEQPDITARFPDQITDRSALSRTTAVQTEFLYNGIEAPTVVQTENGMQAFDFGSNNGLKTAGLVTDGTWFIVTKTSKTDGNPDEYFYNGVMSYLNSNGMDMYSDIYVNNVKVSGPEAAFDDTPDSEVISHVFSGEWSVIAVAHYSLYDVEPAFNGCRTGTCDSASSANAQIGEIVIYRRKFIPNYIAEISCNLMKKWSIDLPASCDAYVSK